MKLAFLKPNDPFLRRVATPIPLEAISSPDTAAIINHMYDTACLERGDRSRPVLVGLAAPQIGLAARAILVDIAADGHGRTGDLRAYINPVITHASQEQYDWYEGCYSTSPVCGVLPRSQVIAINAYTPEGRQVREHYEGYVARVFQHEIDHLNGRLFADYITDDDHLHWVEGADYPSYREQEGWRTWNKKYPRTLWEQMAATSQIENK